jgi:hypothetical protein
MGVVAIAAIGACIATPVVTAAPALADEQGFLDYIHSKGRPSYLRRGGTRPSGLLQPENGRNNLRHPPPRRRTPPTCHSSAGSKTITATS